MKPGIFIGLTNVASQLGDLKEGFQELGYPVSIGVLQEDASTMIKREAYDYVFFPPFPGWLRSSALGKKLAMRVLEKLRPLFLNYRSIPAEILEKHEVFIFIWSSFDTHFRDYQRLVELGKKVVVIFCGDDARWHAAVNQEFAALGLDPVPYEGRYVHFFGFKLHLMGYDFTRSGLKRRMEAIRRAEKFAHVIFSKREQAQLQLRAFYHFPMLIDTHKIPHNSQQRKEKPIVVHAPSSQLVKGTSFVLEVFDRLKAEGIDFEPRLLSGVPNAEALEVFKASDIVIDQLILPGGGRLSSEAMAAGCVVLSRMEYGRYDQGVELSDCPIVDVNPQTLYSELKALILDYPRRQQLADRGRPYVEAHLETRLFCKKVLSALDAPQYVPLDYFPHYFRSSYLPESRAEARLLNRWTQTVWDCPWYRDTIEPGTRAGLIF